MLSEKIQKIGFNFADPEIIFTSRCRDEYSGEKLPFIHPSKHCFFCSFDQAGIVYFRTQTYTIWYFDFNKNLAYVNERTCLFIKELLISNLESISEVSVESFNLMIRSLCLSHYLIERIVFRMEGNWILKQQNVRFNGLLELFFIYLTELQITKNEKALIYFEAYQGVFHPLIASLEFKHLDSESVLNAFVHCFFKNTNKLDCFKEQL